MTTSSEWPRVELAQVPSLERAREIADLVYKSCRLKDLETEEAFAVMYGLGRFNVKLTKLEAVNGGFEALLFPGYDNDKFMILADSYVSGNSNEERYMRIAHEIGHSFFYDRKSKIKLLKQSIITKNIEEEKFCDEFASQLLKLIQRR
ncbi:hypothetical protein HYT25_02715 [Candidatus Pacearchaeota archaeon]|nr:hypothetical protein [Candidatus Pacearchaeota archaeon]